MNNFEKKIPHLVPELYAQFAGYYTIPIKSICESKGKKCVVEKTLSIDKTNSLRSYLVSFTDDGLQAPVSEGELIPNGLLASQSVFEKFQNAQKVIPYSLLERVYSQRFKSN